LTSREKSFGNFSFDLTATSSTHNAPHNKPPHRLVLGGEGATICPPGLAQQQQGSLGPWGGKVAGDRIEIHVEEKEFESRA
jgi:hypothetical protein